MTIIVLTLGTSFPPTTFITQHELLELLIQLSLSEVKLLNVVVVGLQVDQVITACEEDSLFDEPFVLEKGRQQALSLANILYVLEHVLPSVDHTTINDFP